MINNIVSVGKILIRYRSENNFILLHFIIIIILHNYFDGPIIFRSVSNWVFRYFNKIVFRVYIYIYTDIYNTDSITDRIKSVYFIT